MAKLSYLEAIHQGLDQAMERDKDVFVLGEDVGKKGGVFGVTLGLIFDSAKGVSSTRASPYFACKPKVTPKTPPFLPTSSPNTNTSLSLSIA